MFVGHLAVGFAAKRIAPHVNLAWFIASVTALDLLWPIFLLTGIEQVRIVPGAMAFTHLVLDYYPWSHSLVMACVWGVVLGGIAKLASVPSRGALLVGALVPSHWVLDWITHAPDMALWPSAASPKFGLGLWNSIPGTFVVEGAMWIAALAIYLKVRPLRGIVPNIAFWSFTIISTVMWAASPWSAPPPSARALGMFALIGWVILPWCWAADRRPAR